MGHSEDRLVQSEQAIQAILAGHVGTFSQVSGHMDAVVRTSRAIERGQWTF